MSVPTSTEEKTQNLLLNVCDDPATFDSLVENNMANENELYFFPDPIPTKPGNVALLGEDGRLIDSKKQLTPTDIGAATQVHSHSLATTTNDGFFSHADKIKLDGIATNATKTVVDTELSTTSRNPVQNKAVARKFANIEKSIAGKADKTVPVKNGVLAALNSSGGLSDTGATMEFGTWVPSVSGVASYTAQYGSFLRVGNHAMVSFYVYGTFAGDTSKQISITGCPLIPTQNGWCGGGDLSGYTADSNIVFSGWSVNKAGVFSPRGQITVATNGNKYGSLDIYQKASGVFSAAGTVNFMIDNGETPTYVEDANDASY